MEMKSSRSGLNVYTFDLRSRNDEDLHSLLQLLTLKKSPLCSVSRLFVVRQSRAEKIPAIKLGKVYRYRPGTIDSWFPEQEQT